MAVRDDFSAGEVLAAADLNDTFASKVDYATPTNAQAGTAYTFVADDAERLTTASNGSAVTFTIPPQSSVTWGDDTILRVVNYGAGAVTVDGGSGVTVTNTATTVAQYQAAAAIRTGSDAWTLVPFAGGGEIPAAEISSPAATGQYTDGSGDTWDYYTFTSSGTLTVDTAGFADVLVVGGGAGAGKMRGGGGGAGGHLYVTNAYLEAGSLTVTVGAGGAGGSDQYRSAGQNGTTSRVGNYFAPGGGAGGGEAAGAGTLSVGFTGGSGGGSGTSGTGSSGAGTSGQGNEGGVGLSSSTASGGGGGGGASVAGSDAVSNQAGDGGNGTSNSITGSAVTRAGGGGGGCDGRGSASPGAGGSGGGGAGVSTNTTGGAGTANTGGGGGGGGYTTGDGGNGGAGGSGVVIVRVKV